MTSMIGIEYLHRMTVDDLDIPALRTLVAIADARSFTEAAHRLSVEQSTVSYRVKRLRAVLGDPLFLRGSGGLEATARCRHAVVKARSVLATLDALVEDDAFVPADAHGSVVVSCNFHERRSLIPAVVRRLRDEAPSLTVELHEAAVDGRRQLAENLADIVLGPVAMLGQIFYRRHLFDDRYVCVMDLLHPLAKGRLTLERYQSAAHLLVTHNRRWEGLFVPALRARGLAIEPAVAVPSHDSLEALLAGGTLLATIPERLAAEYGDRLAVRRLPIEVPIEISMFWTERTHNSKLHAWVRQVIAEASCGLRSNVG